MAPLSVDGAPQRRWRHSPRPWRPAVDDIVLPTAPIARRKDGRLFYTYILLLVKIQLSSGRDRPSLLPAPPQPRPS